MTFAPRPAAAPSAAIPPVPRSPPLGSNPPPDALLICYDCRYRSRSFRTAMIRPATVHDVPRISEIINSHAELGRMLFKSYAQLYEDLRDFAVYEKEGKIVGCTGLAIIWADMPEIRSLAVDDAYRGQC